MQLIYQEGGRETIWGTWDAVDKTFGGGHKMARNSMVLICQQTINFEASRIGRPTYVDDLGILEIRSAMGTSYTGTVAYSSPTLA